MIPTAFSENRTSKLSRHSLEIGYLPDQILNDSKSSSFLARFSTPSVSYRPLVQTSIHPNCRVAVIVPVRNEAESLISMLSALLHQATFAGNRLDPTEYEVILLANNCSDASAEIARTFAAQHPSFALHVLERFLPPEEAFVGRARQMLMDEAYVRLLSIGRNRGIIASTDGDSEVSPNWITATCWEIDQGADAVGGRIMTSRSSRHQLQPQARRCFLDDVGYQSLVAELESHLDPLSYDPFPRHFQHFGASLAVTVDAYAEAGGLPAVRTPEDEAFYQSLMRVDARFRHSPLVKVTTSARQCGRSPVGLANQLQVWSTQGQAVLKEGLSSLIARLKARRQLRQVWSKCWEGYLLTQSDLSQLAQVYRVDRNWLSAELNNHQNFGTLLEQVQHQGDWLRQWPQVSIQQAMQELRIYLSQLRYS